MKCLMILMMMCGVMVWGGAEEEIRKEIDIFVEGLQSTSWKEYLVRSIASRSIFNKECIKEFKNILGPRFGRIHDDLVMSMILEYLDKPTLTETQMIAVEDILNQLNQIKITERLAAMQNIAHQAIMDIINKKKDKMLLNLEKTAINIILDQYAKSKIKDIRGKLYLYNEIIFYYLILRRADIKSQLNKEIATVFTPKPKTMTERFNLFGKLCNNSTEPCYQISLISAHVEKCKQEYIKLLGVLDTDTIKNHSGNTKTKPTTLLEKFALTWVQQVYNTEAPQVNDRTKLQETITKLKHIPFYWLKDFVDIQKQYSRYKLYQKFIKSTTTSSEDTQSTTTASSGSSQSQLIEMREFFDTLNPMEKVGIFCAAAVDNEMKQQNNLNAKWSEDLKLTHDPDWMAQQPVIHKLAPKFAVLYNELATNKEYKTEVIKCINDILTILK